MKKNIIKELAIIMLGELCTSLFDLYELVLELCWNSLSPSRIYEGQLGTLQTS